MADQVNDAALDRAAALMMAKHLELEAKAYPPEVIDAALNRAYKAAAKTVEVLPDDLRDQAFPIYLKEGLAQSEEWINGVLKMREDTAESKSAQEGGD